MNSMSVRRPTTANRRHGAERVEDVRRTLKAIGWL